MRIKWALLATLILFADKTLAASAFDNLSFALKQQQIITSLREHCNIDENVSDDKIRTVFLNSQTNNELILAAAKAFDQKDTQGYARAIDSVRCPDIK